MYGEFGTRENKRMARMMTYQQTKHKALIALDQKHSHNVILINTMKDN